MNKIRHSTAPHTWSRATCIRWLLACSLLVSSVYVNADSNLPLPQAPAGSAFGQWGYTHEQLAAMVPKPRPEDVASPEAIVKACHEALNGPKGPWNSDRFRSLYSPNAVLTDVTKGKHGEVIIGNRTLSQFIKDVKDVHDESAWYENIEILHVEKTMKNGGGIAMVYHHGIAGSTLTKPKEIGEGLAMVMYDGQRWWIVTDAF